MERNKNTYDDFLTINAGTNKYTDPNFPKDDALYWKDAGEAGRDMAQLEGWVDWMRVSDSNFPNHSFFGPNGISSVNPQDIVQGYIGNCWIMAAVSALAEVPHRIDSFFVNTDVSDAGIYAVQMYTLGVPFTQIVDDWMPLSDGNTLFAGLGKDGSIWGAITEKTFAKRYGNYEHTVGGWMYAGVATINGSPYKIFDHAGLSNDELFNLIKTHDIDKDVMTAASHFCGSHDETNDAGVACSHAYTTIGCGEFSTGSGTVKLIKVRNPWGQEQYGGDYSDDSYLWTDELRAAVHAELGDALEPNNEGIFFMDIDSYKTNFQLSVINQDTSKWNMDYFLALDDDSQETSTDW